MNVQKSIAAYGAFVDIGSTTDGLVHISQLSHSYVNNVSELVSAGQKVNVVLLGVEGETKISLSIKAATPGESIEHQPPTSHCECNLMARPC